MSSTLDVSALGSFIREHRENAEVSLRQLAKASGVSNPYLSQVERGLRNPSAEILGQIARALRISAETLYVQAGLLEEKSDEPVITTVAQAIAADRSLTERQRSVISEIYAAFQAENAAPNSSSAPTTKPAPKKTSKSSSAKRITKSASA